MQSKAEQHAEQLAWHLESWSSIEMTVERDIIPSRHVERDRPSAFDRSVIRYIETAVGKRLYDERMFKDDELAYRQTYYFDGRRGADVTADRANPETQHQAVIHRHFGRENQEVHTQRPKPLRWYWVDREPLHEVLPQARELGQAEVLGRACDLFLLSETGHTGTWDQVFYLDTETTLPLKLVVYKTRDDRLAEQPLLVWTAEEIGEFQGYPIVTKSVQETYTAEGGRLSETREFQVESATFNRDYPSSTFWPEFQPGTNVYDSVKGVSYQVPDPEGDEAFESSQTTDTQSTATTLDPAIRADPPKSWSFYATSATLGLGCAAILVSLWLWWRRE